MIRNVAETESNVTISIPWTDRERRLHNLALDPLLLQPGEVRDLSQAILTAVQSLPLDTIVSSGIELQYSSAPGTVLAVVQSVSDDGEYVLQVPLVDPEVKGSAGNYPWRISSESSTYLHVKNTSGELQYFTAQVDFQGGAYVVGPRGLRPGETDVIDMRSLRNGQIPDDSGNVVPLDAESGQIHWSVVGPNARNHSVVGRSEQVDLRGFSSTFACDTCCPDSFNRGWVAPIGGTEIPEALTSLFRGWQENINCFGMVLNPWVVSWASWVSSNPSSAAVDSGGLVTGVSVGQGLITGGWTGVRYTYHSAGVCMEEYVEFGVGSNAWVYNVRVGSANIAAGTDGEIGVVFETPSGITLPFKLELIPASGSPHTLATEQVMMVGGGRSYTFKIAQLPTQEFTAVRATWGGKSHDLGYRFRVLGNYLISQYNTPKEVDCTGSLQTACTSNTNCVYTTRSMKSLFISETFENGHGLSINYGMLEWGNWCWTNGGPNGPYPLSTPCTSSNTFGIDQNGVIPSCGGAAAIGMLAVNKTHPYLAQNNAAKCGAQVLIHGHGVKTIRDLCARCIPTQLDHYAGVSGCNDVGNLAENTKVIQLSHF